MSATQTDYTAKAQPKRGTGWAFLVTESYLLVFGIIETISRILKQSQRPVAKPCCPTAPACQARSLFYVPGKMSTVD
jgi:hypothetical protein